MWLINRRSFLVMLFCVTFTVFNAQTLYWIGGDGHFSDPSHWSLSSGGPSAHKVPGASDNVMFDDNSGAFYTVTLSSTITVKSFVGGNAYKTLNLKGSRLSVLNCSGDFMLSSMTTFDFLGSLVLKSNNSTMNRVSFGVNTLNCNVAFKEGNFRISALAQTPNHKVSFEKGHYKFRLSSLIADRLEIKGAATTFEIDSSLFNIRKSVSIPDKPDFNSHFFTFYAPFSDHANVIINPQVTFGSDRAINSDNSVFSVCGASVYAYASCNSCTGIYSLSIDPACTGMYNIIVSSSSGFIDCTNTADSLSANDAVAGVYTYTNACYCPASSYNIFMYDPATTMAVTPTVIAGGSGSNFNFNPTTINLNTIGPVTLPSCNSSCNGAMNLQVSGGTSPYTITVLPAVVSTFSTNGFFNLSTLCGGVYSFTITDFKGCSSVITKTVTAPSQLAANPFTQSITCNGTCNGSFSISPNSTGTPTYIVKFSTGATFSNTSATATVGIGGLCQGAITATITDSKGCTVTANSSILQPPALIVAQTQTNVTCGGSCDGSASVAVSGGVSPYTYSWSPVSSTVSAIHNICAGSYTVIVKDNNNCTYTPVPTFSITQPASITISQTITNVTCHGQNTGSAVATATGGIATINFTWVATGNATVSTSSSLNSVAAGIYTLFASDGSCTINKIITITEPPALTITAVSQSVACVGACTGAATVNVSGGNGGPFTYSWTTTPPQTTPSASSLCAGSYSVSVKDASNCPTSTFVTIAQPNVFNPAITSSTLSCSAVCTGTIGSSPSGGVAPYNYTLTSASLTIVSATPSFTGLCAGNYTLSISDALSPCGQNFTVTLVEPNTIVPSITTTSISCFGECNGILAGSAIGGVPGYTYTWGTSTGTISGGILSGRCAGNYTLTVNDSHGCVKTTSASILQPTDISYTVTPLNASCYGSCNGILSANVSGGVPGYTLNWSNGVSGTPNSSLCAGSYTLNIIDFNGCPKTATALITQPLIIVPTKTTAATACATSCDGSATISATGGTPSYTYAFNTSPVVTNTTGAINTLCAGNYIASVSDANGCSQSIPFSVVSPVALSAAITGTQSSCSSCTGASTVTPSNGLPGYSYAWTNSLSATVSTINTVSGLCPGNYTITVTDAKNCTASASVGILETVVGAPVSGGTGIQCYGACTASAVVNPTGGSLPYSFTWTPTGQTTQTATGLCAGSYTVLVKEGSPAGCVSTSTINITSPPSLSVNTTQSNITCNNACNGAITATASGGTGVLSYSWSPGGQTTSGISNLCAGIYSLQVTDANGCTSAVQVFTISEPTPIVASFTTNAPTTCTLTNGNICVSASGGSGGPYTYTWTPVVSNATCIAGLSAGAYSVTISDGVVGCTNSLHVLLNNPTGPTLTLVGSQSVTCYGGINGSATISAIGASPITYTWAPAVATTTAPNTTMASGLGTGTYVITGEDINSCVTSFTVPILQASSLTVNSTVTNPKCNDAVCNGSIVVATPLGGTPGYTYLWSPGGATTQNLNNICSGNYSLVITDSHACQTPYTYNIIAPPVFTITTTSNNIQCFGACNGSIVANAFGGTAAISYSWLASGAFSGATTATVVNLCAGIYTVNATDGNNCAAQGTNTIQIVEPPLLTSTLTLQNASCSNSCNAFATQTAAGGTFPYSFGWSIGTSTTSTIGGLCAGNYTGTAIDAAGCTVAKGFTVIPPAAFTATLIPSNPKCNPLSNPICSGSVTTNLFGAQGAVSYTWIPFGSGQNPTNLCSGVYTLMATDASSCSILQVVNLIDPPALISNATYSNPTCNGACNGIAVITPTNAAGAVTITWTPSAPNTPTITGLCSGNYSVSIKDNNGCLNIQTFTLIDPPVLNVNTSNSAASCIVANGSITAVASGGLPGPGGYTYFWSPPAVSTTSIATNLSAGLYTLQVSDGLCTNTVYIPLSNANGPNSAPIVSSSIICNSQCTGAASINPATITGGTPGYTVSWLAPPASSTVNPLTNLCAGVYTAKIIDAGSCVLFNNVTIAQPSPISTQPSVAFPNCVGVCNGSISLATSGGDGAYTYSWFPAVSSSSVATNLCPGNYTVNVAYGGTNNCTSSAQIINLPAVTNIGITTGVIPNPCFGNCVGSAFVTSATGIGSTQFTYAWSNGQNGPTASGFCNGNYSITANSPSGCSSTFTFDVTSPAAITSTVAVTQPSCNQCNGTAVINASGGIGPNYTYSWTTGINSSTVANLCAGLYQVVVTDVNSSCQQTETVVVNNSNGITGENFNTQNILCANTCNGSTTVTAIGGNAPITYQWLNPAVTNSILTNLCGGTYYVQMSDLQGCLRTASVSISSTSSISISQFIYQPGCIPPSTGSIDVIVSGGTPGYTYSWQPSGNTTASLTNITAGSYTLTVTDSSAAHCTLTKNYNISNLNGPVITYTQTDISCFGSCNGSLVTNASGTGTTFNWSTGSTSQTVTNLCAGVITLTVTAQNGCETIQSFTIVQNPQLLVNAPQIIQPTCNMCNGGATVTPFGGLLPYTYSWTTNATSPGVSGLCAGIYEVTIADAALCAQTYTFFINNSSGITGQNFTVQNIICGGNCNGSATVAAIGGSAPITYQWISPSITNSVITNLCAGNYLVQMTDANNCIRTASVDINAAVSLSITGAITSPSCTGSNGEIDLTITGGTPAYSVSWFPGGTTSPTLSGISAGSYTVTVHDSPPGTCTVTQSFNVSNTTGPTVLATQSNINCFGSCTGMISAVGSVAGNTTGLVYEWSNGATVATVSGLCQGVITLTVTDPSTGCKTIRTYTITQNSDININAPSVTQPSCNQCNGTASISVFGGVAPYNYVWTNSATTPFVIDLCAGVYQVQVTDALQCQKTHNVLINNSTGISGENFNVQNIQCANNCNGAATVTAVGGNPPINYNWLTPATSGSVISNLCSGDYFVQMSDAQGCIRNASVAITPAFDFTVSTALFPPTCGVTPANGSVNVGVSGGSGSYQYSWTPTGNVTAFLNNVGAGNYSIVVTDAVSGCSHQNAVNLSNPTGPAVTFTQANISCFGNCTGSVIAISTSTNALTFVWSTGSVVSAAASSTVSNLCKGAITVTVTDNITSCQTVSSFNLSDNSKIEISIPNVIQPTCHNSCDGQITLLPSGGSLPYLTYSWSPIGNGTNPQTGLCAGDSTAKIYTVVVSDSKGCANTTTIQLNNPPEISLSYTVSNSSCSAVADGSIGITPSGGTPTYTPLWTGPGAYTGSTSTINNLFPGTYSLHLQDQRGCSRDTTLKLVSTVSVQAMAGPDATVCPTASVVLSGTNSVGSTNITYSWFMNTSTVTASTDDSLYIPSASNTSTYILQVNSTVQGCFDQDTVVVNIIPIPIVDAGPTFTIPVFSTVIIGGSPTAFGNVSVSWSPSTSLNDPTLQNPVASNTLDMTYTVTVTDNVTGCIATDVTSVDLFPAVIIPNGFSPNSDGKNDRWIIDYMDQFPESTVEVYNRWGDQLFYSKGYNTPFDGRYHNKDLPVGTYYYIINLNHPAYPKAFTGPLTIFR